MYFNYGEDFVCTRFLIMHTIDTICSYLFFTLIFYTVPERCNKNLHNGTHIHGIKEFLRDINFNKVPALFTLAVSIEKKQEKEKLYVCSLYFQYFTLAILN